MYTNFEADTMFTACESLFNYISVMDDMDDIAMESDGSGSDNSIPWYKKILKSIKTLIMKIKTKFNEFFMKKLENTPGITLLIPNKVVEFVKKVLKAVDKQGALLKNIDFINYSNNASMVISKVDKTVAQIEELASAYCKGGDLKKARAEMVANINSSGGISADNVLSTIKKEISDSVSNFETNIDTILKNAEKYSAESKQAATNACAVCTKLLKIVDMYVRYALSAALVMVRSN